MTVLVALLACDGGAPACDGQMELLLADLAGGDSIDCGVVEHGQDSTSTDACVVDAFTDGTAFRAGYEEFGVDSYATDAWASDGVTLWSVQYTVGVHVDKLTSAQCLSPALVISEGRLPLECDDLGPEDAVCGGDR